MATKQAHFVPQTYLRGFLFDEKKERVYAYNSRSNLITPTKINKICSQSYLYRVKDKDDNDSDEIEEMLAKDIEPKYQGLLNTVRLGEWIDKTTIADISTFTTLSAFTSTRYYGFFEETGIKFLKDALKDELSKLLDDNARKAMMDEFKKDDPVRFEKLLKETPDFTGELSRQDIIFPIAKDVCIVINGPGYFQKVGVVTPETVDIINRMVSSRPNIQYLISAQRSLVEKYSRYLVSPPQTQE